MISMKRHEPGIYTYDTTTNEYHVVFTGRRWRITNYNKVMEAWVDNPPSLFFSTLREARKYITYNKVEWR